MNKTFQPSFNSKIHKVAEISFAFENHEAIDLLRERGTAMKAILNKNEDLVEEDFEPIKKVEEKINSKLNEPNIVNDRFSTPVCAFIVFEREEGLKEALAFTREATTSSYWNSCF